MSDAAPLASSSDAELIEALQARQPMALSVLYDRYASLVYGLALKMMANVSDAEDLVQEVFVTLGQGASYDARRGSVSSFLCALTRARALERLRAQESQHPFWKSWQPTCSGESVRAAPFEQLSMEERRQVVRAALSQLSDNQRQLLELLYYQGLTQAEVARHLRIPLATVKSRSRQALCQLRNSLQTLLR
ncbi:MAG: sigma-70 family RNA polymerase sigma factor [Thermostichus sp. DG_1_6_bins_120]